MKKAGLKKLKIVLVIGLLVVVGTMILISERKKSHGRYSGVSMGNEIRFFGTEEVSGNDGNLFVTTRNGTRGYAGDGGLMMDVAYELDHPYAVSREDVVAIGDIGGTGVYVISAKGIPHSYKTELPIVKLCVAEDGTTAVLLDNGAKDIIRIYTPEGEPKVEIGTRTAADGFPVDIALSKDGKKLATLYLSFEGEDIVSKVTFYNTGDVGKNFIENIVGQKIYSGEMAYSVDFMGSNSVALVFGNGFSLFSMVEIPSLVKDERCSEKLLDVRVCDECISVLAKGEKSNTLTFYNKSGSVSGKVAGLGNCENLTLANGEALIVDGPYLKIYRMNGTTKLDCTFDGGGEKLYYGGGVRYFVAEPDRIRTMTLVK